jgi:AcrR family transcriptional regulator/DNA-binding MarR family transcriptional regulator
MSAARERPVSRHRGSRPAAVASPRRGGMQLSEVQRSRMLTSAVAVVSEHGYGQMTVARIAGAARVSRRTFYDLFEDREDCFLAVFDDAVARASAVALAAYGSERGWRRQVRAGLGALLGFLDEQPGLGGLLVVDALKAGPRVQARRAEVLHELAETIQRGSRSGSARELPPLTGEGVVGAVLGVGHTRLLADRPGPMRELLNPLMAMVVLPCHGPAAAQRELEHPDSNATRTPGTLGVGGGTAKRAQDTPSSSSSSASSGRSPLDGLPMRLTYRTVLVLTAIADQPGTSNREVAAAAGVSDQGQISKLLARLERLGLIENTGEGQPSGEPNAWRLTPRGEGVLDTSRPVHSQASAPTTKEIR